jgi:hypothetical protein
MRLWTPIEASRYALGAAWLPQLSLQMLGNDFAAAMEIPFNWWTPQVSTVITNPPVDAPLWWSVLQIPVAIPSFALDVDFGDLRIMARIALRAWASPAPTGTLIRLGDEGTAQAITGSATSYTLAGKMSSLQTASMFANPLLRYLGVYGYFPTINAASTFSVDHLYDYDMRASVWLESI